MKTMLPKINGSSFVLLLGVSVGLCAALISGKASAAKFGGGPITVGPYASVSSTKAIKPVAGKDTGSSEETITQRTTYGVKVDLRLGRLFTLSVNGGQNEVDTTKKPIAMRDEYGDIDFTKDLNVDPNSQTATYRYRETQRLGSAQLVLAPALMKGVLWGKLGAGARARERLITISDEIAQTTKSTKDPLRWSAMATAGVQLRLLGAFNAGVEYKFYFLKFPKTEPHEQEAVVSFGMSI
jgi:hypothetical protein